MEEQNILFIFQLVQIIIATLSTIAVAISLVFLARQTRAAQQQTKYVAETNIGMMFTTILSQALEFDRFLIANPDVYAYFYRSKHISKNNPKYPKILFTAFQFLDLIDGSLLQQKMYPQLWPENWWRGWAIDMFTTSSVLRQVLEESSCWYSQEILELKRIADQRIYGFPKKA